jgi:hypothetical protein
LWEDAFILLYKVPGMTYDALEGMEKVERRWWRERLIEQLKAEIAHLKKKD